MKSPLLIVCNADDWLRELSSQIAAESRWLLQSCTPGQLLKGVMDRRPTVALVVIDPHDSLDGLTALVQVSQYAPEVATAVLTASKITETDRASWLALALDCGARSALFPPYTRLVLDDLIGGLMASCARQAGISLDRPKRRLTPETEPDGAIDLAGGDYEEPA